MRSRVSFAAFAAMAVWASGASDAQAQVPTVSQPVVQPAPIRPASMQLNDALNMLARSPQDVDALIEAGRASLDLGDVQAAIGFYQRADMLSPGSLRAKIGLAGAHVLSGDPVAAIELFNQADKLGPLDASAWADRGLAYDLVGDNRTAQQHYQRALTMVDNDETRRRLALSRAISRDKPGMDTALAPLLARNDKAAWRTLAFGQAILGNITGAETIVRQSVPEQSAERLVGYMGFMPRLSPAQQAAAGNLGLFPRSSQIGQDDPRFAAYAQPRPVLAVAGQTPGPTEGKGKDKSKDKDKGKGKPAVLAAAAPQIPPIGRDLGGKPGQLAPNAPLAGASPAWAAAPASRPDPAPQLAASGPVPAPAGTGPASRSPGADPPAGGVAVRTATPGFGSLPPPLAAVSDSRPATAAAARPRSIDDAFAGFEAPSREVEPRVGAIDVRTIRPPTALAAKAPDSKDPKAKASAQDQGTLKAKGANADKAKGADKAKDADKARTRDGKGDGPSHPSRIWVQIATGRDKGALSFDWKRMVRDTPDLFKGQRPHVTAWGQSNRLLTGPFASQKEASAFLARLKKAGMSGGFIWTSPAGQVVDVLSGGK